MSSRQIQCRICFGGAEEADEFGELIAPCCCRGSLAMVHFNCLRAWCEANDQLQQPCRVQLLKVQGNACYKIVAKAVQYRPSNACIRINAHIMSLAVTVPRYQAYCGVFIVVCSALIQSRHLACGSRRDVYAQLAEPPPRVFVNGQLIPRQNVARSGEGIPGVLEIASAPSRIASEGPGVKNQRHTQRP